MRIYQRNIYNINDYSGFTGCIQLWERESSQEITLGCLDINDWDQKCKVGVDLQAKEDAELKVPKRYPNGWLAV